MDLNLTPDVHQYLKAWSQDLKTLRQNDLLYEVAFIRFANDHGIDVWGALSGDPDEFTKRDWLVSDDTNGLAPLKVTQMGKWNAEAF